MSWFQFLAATGGYAKAHGSQEDEQVLSNQEAAQLADFIDQPPVWH